MKQIHIFVMFILAILGIFGYLIWRSSIPTDSIVETITQDTNKLTPTSTHLLPPATQTEIRAFLAKKYNRPESEVQVTIKKEAPGYASGSVKFGQGGVGEGGVWLAVQNDKVWQVIFDGNGSVDCNKMRQEYGFPDIILRPDFCEAEAFEVESAVRAYVALQAEVIEDLVIITSRIKKDWSDSCLGLGGPAESCLVGITPGYEIAVNVNGAEETYRTNVDGSQIRRKE